MKPRILTAALFTAACAGVVAGGNLLFNALQPEQVATGRFISPPAIETGVGSFPGHMITTPDGRFVVVSNFGFRQQLSVLDANTGKLVSSIPFNGHGGPGQMYFGLAFGPDGKLYVSEGGEDKIGIVDIDGDGTAHLEGSTIGVPPSNPKEPNFISGLAFSPDGKKLYAVGNETYWHDPAGILQEDEGTLNVIDLASGQVTGQLRAGAFPFDVAVITQGPKAGKIYVSSERDGNITVYSSDTDTGIMANGAKLALPKIETGANAANLLLNRDQSRLYCSNPSSDTVSVIDTGTDRVISTILIRPPQARGLGGVTPLGLALSPDGSTLYTAAADLNAIAVIDTAANKVKGYIPAGWYPTSVAVSGDGQRLFAANAKGISGHVPNNKKVGSWGTYIENILEGTVSEIDLSQSLNNLGRLSDEVFALNQFGSGSQDHFKNPGIKHVIYIVKENRTYDQLFGDIATGNGDKSVCFFPREVTPNQHALAERFVLLDNFYVCSQVSADGWNWSTAGMASDYTERNTVVNYSGRGRAYDFEGTDNDFPADLWNQRDVAEPEGGYLWDAAAKAGVSFRNYGFFVDSADGPDFKRSNKPNRKLLYNNTDMNFREFDTAYADSDAWVKLGQHAPRQMLTFGGVPCRYTTWKEEWNQYVANDNLPGLMLMRVMRDHTAGTARGESSPRAMVADNDYAIGEIVDTVSHSKYWKDTVICVLEDDAQAGQDHVDCHRSLALVISPYIEKGTVDHRFWNTDSMLRTIVDILGLKPMNQYVGFSRAIDVFHPQATNDDPYDAIMPAANIITEVNGEHAYRAKDSERLIKRFDEEDEADLQLNDILAGDFRQHEGSRP